MFLAEYRAGHAPSDYDARLISKRLLEASFRLDESSLPSCACIPPSATCESRHKALPDLFHVEGRICVSERLRAVIEDGDLGKHQFFPIELKKRDGDLFDGEFFLLNILTKLDTLCFEQSNLKRYAISHNQSLVTSPSPSGPDWRTHYAGRLQDEQIWREEIIGREFYLSDKAGERIKREKLMGFTPKFFFPTKITARSSLRKQMDDILKEATPLDAPSRAYPVYLAIIRVQIALTKNTLLRARSSSGTASMLWKERNDAGV